MTTKAPLFNSFNALKPIPPRSGVVAVLDAADKISRQTIEADRLARDNAKLREQASALAEAYERLVEENAELRCRIQELEAEVAAKGEQIGDLQGRLIAMHDDLESTRNQLHQAREERNTFRAQVTR